MSTIFYEVQAEIKDFSIEKAWVDWILDGHIQEVIDCSANSGRLVKSDQQEGLYFVQYEFSNRDDFDLYIADHAPRLREEGLRKFSPEQIVYNRRTGGMLGVFRKD